MKTAAIYARVSTDDQTNNTSLESQIESGRKYASERGWRVVEEVRESWTGTDLDRPGINKLRDLAETGAIQAVIVRDLDRLSRGSVDGSMWHIGYLLEAFERAHAPVHIVSRPRAEGEGEDDGGDIRIDFDAILAVEEKRRIRRRLKRGKMDSVKNGQISGSGLVPFGYRYVPVLREGGKRLSGGHYEVIEADAAWIRRIFEWVAVDGCSLNEVCARLQEEGVPTRRGGKEWTRSTVRAMLRNSTYAGRYVYNRTESCEPAADRRLKPAGKNRKTTARIRPESEWLYIECPAIVTEELYRAAGARLSYNQEHAARGTVRTYLLRGLLWCGECARQGKKHKLIGHAMTSRGGRHTSRYYDCSGRFNNTRASKEERCKTPHHNADRVEDAIWRKLVAALSDPQTVRLALSTGADQGARRAAERDMADREAAELGLERARRKEDRFIASYGEGVIDLPALKKHVAATKAEALGYELQRDAARARMEGRAQAEASRAQLEELVAMARIGLPTLPQEDRRAFLEALEFKATVDEQGNVDFDAWLTERLLPYLQPSSNTGVDMPVQHSRTKPTPASPTWRSPR